MKLDFFLSPSIYLFLSYKSNSWIFPFEIITLTLHRKHLWEKCTWFFIYVGVWFAQVNYLRHLWPPWPFTSVVTGALLIRKETYKIDILRQAVIWKQTRKLSLRHEVYGLSSMSWVTRDTDMSSISYSLHQFTSIY